MTPSVRTLQGSKQKSFRGSKLLCPRGSNTRGFSMCIKYTILYFILYIYNIKIYSNDLMLKVENTNDTHDT